MEETHGHLHELAPARTRAHVCSRVQAFDEAEGIDKLEALQTHHNEEVYEKAVAILEKHFGEEDDDDENILPQAQAADGMFSFGAQPIAATAGFAF